MEGNNESSTCAAHNAVMRFILQQRPRPSSNLLGLRLRPIVILQDFRDFCNVSPNLLSSHTPTYHSLLFPLLEGAKVGEDLEGRAPLLELKLPVQHHRGGHYDQVGAPVAPVTRKVGQESNGLEVIYIHVLDAMQHIDVHVHVGLSVFRLNSWSRRVDNIDPLLSKIPRVIV